MSTLVSTSAAFSALAIAGSQNAAAYGTSDADQHTGLSASMSEEEIAALPRVKQELVAPPFAPEHEQVASGGPKVVEVTLTTPEIKMDIDGNGTEIWALTFNGSVPGPLIICHEGDFVELTLVNPKESSMVHNIDFHASTGGLGGGTLSSVSPGEQMKLRWRATKPGVFVYHCAPGGVMIPYHVVHGMNGACMVLPRDGLKRQGWQSPWLRSDFLCWRAGLLCTEGRKRQLQKIRCSRRQPGRCAAIDGQADTIACSFQRQGRRPYR